MQLSMLDHALRYARKGWAVVPLHGTIGDKCTCHNAECRSTGKHPRTEHGIDDATADATQIKAWWARWPEASIGLACGELSGVFVIDVDVKVPRDGISGIRALELLEEQHGALPLTLESSTGGGGRHLFFRLPEGRAIRNRVALKGPDGQRTSLDVRAAGGYVVLPPSRHKSGHPYTWKRPPGSEKIEIADAPVWLVDLIDPPDEERPKLEPVHIGQVYMDRAQLYAARVLENACQRILAAPEGSRHVVLNKEAYTVGGYVGGGYLPEADARHYLRAAGLAAGKGTKEVDRTVDDALKKGAEQPIHPKLTERPRREPEPLEEDASDVVSVDLNHRNLVLQKCRRTQDRVDRQTGELVYGNPKATLHNAVVILQEDPSWRGRLRYDLFLDHVLIDGQPLTDDDLIDLRAEIDTKYRVSFGGELMLDATTHVARSRSFDPLKDYLEGLVWDGTPRITKLLPSYFGAGDSEINERYGARFLIGAVARAMSPGEKLDTILVLKGGQGIGKSTAIAALLPRREWFTDEYIDVSSKEGPIVIRGKWLVEVAELDSFRGKAQTAIKAFTARAVDHYRAPYDKVAEDHPRRSVFVGTTNAETFLGDSTGARRFWVATVGKCDVAAIKRDRDQLWAEAVTAWRRGEPWWLTEDEQAVSNEVNEEHQLEEPWETAIARWRISPEASQIKLAHGGFTSYEVMQKALGFDAPRMTRQAQMAVGDILRKQGLKRTRVRREGGLTWLYQ